MDNSIHNIDIFNASAALIFGELYKNVPVPTTLNYQKLSLKILEENNAASPSTVLEVFINTVTWLKKSGFVWLDSEGELDVYGALLSPKGLEVLSIIPESSIVGEAIGITLSNSEMVLTNEEKAALVKIAISAGNPLL